MYIHTTSLKVRYAETDQMGVVHHGNYASYLEQARIEWLDELGFSYKKMESEGIMLPVYDLKFSFKYPAFFDEILHVKTSLGTLSGAKISLDYHILNEAEKVITEAQSTLVFVDAKTRRPIRCPKALFDRLSGY